MTKNLPDLESKTAEEILKWGYDTFKERVALSSSFGIEDVVLIDMWLKVNPKGKIFTIDTGRLPQETYDVIERIKEKYNVNPVRKSGKGRVFSNGVNIDFYFPDTKEIEEMLKKYGPNLFYGSIELRKLCCHLRKVRPLGRALRNLEAWITGLRREQAVTRTQIKKVEIDKAHNNIIKINPLADWKKKDVWNYIKKNNLPYNALHDKNYPSIGCAPCTRRIKPGEDIRAGRWWWERPEQKECGLHICKTDRTSQN